MKLLIQSDDYGITKAQALGCIEAIKYRMLRNTGIFTNMPWFDEVAEWIKPYINDIALGIDLNASTGPSVCDPSEIPDLVQPNGYFLTSNQNRALDTPENNYDHVNYEQLKKEFKAQFQKYVDKFGKLPDYVSGHAYGTKTTVKVLNEIADEYGLIHVTYHGRFYLAPTWRDGVDYSEYWYGDRALENQAKPLLKEFILNDVSHFVEDDVPIGWICCHTGYVEKTLFDLSSFTLFRMNDLDAMTSPEVKKFYEDHNVEFITWKDVEKGYEKAMDVSQMNL